MLPKKTALFRSGRTRSVSLLAKTGTWKAERKQTKAKAKNKGRFIYDFSDFGSNQSRSASPRKLKDRTVNTSAKDGNTTMCGASNKWLRPSLSIAPQLGVGGAMPSPRKLSDASN